ncbi:MAG: type II toxin-antitoxin system YafQ family toxin [Prevotella sp.]|nr:type II toxin-antitoxin system YafQ family toxin [Prevotella sp.]
MDKYKLEMAIKFKRDVKRCKKRGLPLDELWDVVRTLLRGEPLAPKYKAHILTGDHKGEWECHIQPDWLLLWEQRDDQLVLLMLTTGTHSDIYGKIRR